MEKLLIVEDDSFFRKIFSDLLTAAGYVVEAAATGKEALELLTGNDYQVVITDMIVPDISGLDILSQVKDKDQYEALRDKGYSKQKSARIANSKGAEKRGGKAGTYEDRTKADLYEEAKKVGIEGRSKMTKAELAKALRTN